MLDILLGFAVLVGALVLIQCKRSTEKQFPPGPKGYPLIGNALDLPMTDNVWEFFANKAKVYGNILGFRALGEHIVILNSVEDAHDLLSQTQCSDRPQPVMLELIRASKIFGADRYSDDWRLRRKLFHHQMNKNAVGQFSEFSEKQSRLFIARLHERPDTFMDEIRLTAAKVILGVTYGVEVHSMEDELVQLPEKHVKEGSEAFLGFWLVNYIPLLRHLPLWMPGAGGPRFAAAFGDTTVRMVTIPYEAVKRQMVEGTAQPSFLRGMLESKAAEEDLIMWLSGSMYAAGSDTTVSSLHAFFLALLLFPDVQRKAQEEIDRVCPDRMPDLADRDYLPYINAVVSETLRWYMFAPMALPHVVTEDTVYKGYFMPKGTTIMANTWSMSQDPKVYPNPERFLPERFISSDEASLPMDPRRFTFGFGRRICPGQDFADMNLFLAISSVLATSVISNALDDAGKPIVPDVRTTGGPFRYLKPFRCTIKPRSVAAEALIKECAAA